MTKINHVEQLKTLAIEAFKDHKLTHCDENRWMVARRNGGQFESVYATEIISLWNGRLFVGGDIDDCVFAYYGDTKSHRNKLRWIGECEDVEYYVYQKARMGLTDNGKLTSDGRSKKFPNARVIYAWAAVRRLCQLLDEIDSLMKSDNVIAVQKGIDNLCPSFEKTFLYEHLKLIRGDYK